MYPLYEDQCLVAGDPPTPVIVHPPDLDADLADLVLLGLAGGTPQFAADLTGMPRAEALARTGADTTADVRALYATLPAGDSAVLAYARGLLRSNRQQCFCGSCGAPSQPQNGASCGPARPATA